MPGPKLCIGPTHALRLALKAAPWPLNLFELRDALLKQGVATTRADRAIRRALKHDQIAQNMDGTFRVKEDGAW